MNIQQQPITKNEQNFEKNQNDTFQYRLHKQYSVQQNKWCKAIAFNKNSTILAIGCNEIIKLYEFKEGDLKLFKSIQGHSFDVNCLKWSNYQNQLISAGYDGKILFWSINSINHQKLIMKFVIHSLSITCLIMNTQENFLITGSMDQTIQIMNQNYQKFDWNTFQVIKEHVDTIFALSLSQNQKKLISCGYDNLIIVLENNGLATQKNYWIVKQKIITNVHGYRLCFLKDYLFAFQPYNKEELWIFDDQNLQKQFKSSKIIQIKSECDDFASLFPQQFIQNKRIILSKNGNFIHLIKFLDQDDFQVIQEIDFGDQCIYGQLSPNGKYLVTWDNKSNFIQIRLLDEQQ
ncbi:unnamed protein product [Paramecium sonneborni]|uniref:WD40-repeat-containing domain n=1 Tax=Paramecium sonneborni TaxID=65129 RepID=A0A8S1Q376_9CILI|nr:unnamed protein product [Paramecium sonneborni]